MQAGRPGPPGTQLTPREREKDRDDDDVDGDSGSPGGAPPDLRKQWGAAESLHILVRTP